MNEEQCRGSMDSSYNYTYDVNITYNFVYDTETEELFFENNWIKKEDISVNKTWNLYLCSTVSSWRQMTCRNVTDQVKTTDTSRTTIYNEFNIMVDIGDGTYVDYVENFIVPQHIYENGTKIQLESSLYLYNNSDTSEFEKHRESLDKYNLEQSKIGVLLVK